MLPLSPSWSNALPRQEADRWCNSKKAFSSATGADRWRMQRISQQAPCWNRDSNRLQRFLQNWKLSKSLDYINDFPLFADGRKRQGFSVAGKVLTIRMGLSQQESRALLVCDDIGSSDFPKEKHFYGILGLSSVDTKGGFTCREGRRTRKGGGAKG